MADIVERLRSSEPLPACPFDRISPHYLTMPDDKPCPFCGQENTLEGPDKCRGADTRIMGEAADEIERLRGVFEQVKTVCIDNATDTVRHDLALQFVGKLAEKALSRHHVAVGGARE